MVLSVKNRLMVILDIGASKIVCMVAYVTPNNIIEVVAVSYQSSQGFKNGIIKDIKLAETSILSVLKNIEKLIGERIEKVIVTMPLSNLNSSRNSYKVNISNSYVTDKEVSHLINLALSSSVNNNEKEILYCQPIEYDIDGNGGIQNPKAMYGKELKVDIHMLTVMPTSLLNLSHCLAKCHLEFDDFIVSIHSAALACLNKTELEQGSLIIDMGASHTSFAIFYNNNMVFADSIPIGGSHVTADIAYAFSLPFHQAEKIKSLHGNAQARMFDQNSMIDISDVVDLHDMDNNLISQAMLNDVINARLEEILELIKNKTRTAELRKYPVHNIVLTGGASQMLGINDFVSTYLSKPSRIGIPTLLKGLDKFYATLYSLSAVGALIYAFNNYKNVMSNEKKDKNIFKKVLNLLKL